MFFCLYLHSNYQKTKPYEKIFVIVACMFLHKCGDGAETI